MFPCAKYLYKIFINYIFCRCFFNFRHVNFLAVKIQTKQMLICCMVVCSVNLHLNFMYVI